MIVIHTHGRLNVRTIQASCEEAPASVLIQDPKSIDGGCVAVTAPGSTQCCGAVRFVSTNTFTLNMFLYLLKEYGKSVCIFEQTARLETRVPTYTPHGNYKTDRYGDIVYTTLPQIVQQEIKRLNETNKEDVCLSYHELDAWSFMVLIDATTKGGDSGSWRNFK